MIYSLQLILAMLILALKLTAWHGGAVLFIADARNELKDLIEERGHRVHLEYALCICYYTTSV